MLRGWKVVQNKDSSFKIALKRSWSLKNRSLVTDVKVISVEEQGEKLPYFEPYTHPYLYPSKKVCYSIN